MSDPSQNPPLANERLDPEHPDFFARCREYAIRVICPKGQPCRDPAFQASAIRIVAAALAFTALDDETIPSFPSKTRFPCACGGDAAGPRQRCRNRKPKSGGRIP
jgi:hypothetical protein